MTICAFFNLDDQIPSHIMLIRQCKPRPSCEGPTKGLQILRRIVFNDIIETTILLLDNSLERVAIQGNNIPKYMDIL